MRSIPTPFPSVDNVLDTLNRYRPTSTHLDPPGPGTNSSQFKFKLLHRHLFELRSHQMNPDTAKRFNVIQLFFPTSIFNDSIYARFTSLLSAMKYSHTNTSHHPNSLTPLPVIQYYQTLLSNSNEAIICAAKALYLCNLSLVDVGITCGTKLDTFSLRKALSRHFYTKMGNVDGIWKLIFEFADVNEYLETTYENSMSLDCMLTILNKQCWRYSSSSPWYIVGPVLEHLITKQYDRITQLDIVVNLPVHNYHSLVRRIIPKDHTCGECRGEKYICTFDIYCKEFGRFICINVYNVSNAPFCVDIYCFGISSHSNTSPTGDLLFKCLKKFTSEIATEYATLQPCHLDIIVDMLREKRATLIMDRFKHEIYAHTWTHRHVSALERAGFQFTNVRRDGKYYITDYSIQNEIDQFNPAFKEMLDLKRKLTKKLKCPYVNNKKRKLTEISQQETTEEEEEETKEEEEEETKEEEEEETKEEEEEEEDVSQIAQIVYDWSKFVLLPNSCFFMKNLPKHIINNEVS